MFTSGGLPNSLQDLVTRFLEKTHLKDLCQLPSRTIIPQFCYRSAAQTMLEINLSDTIDKTEFDLAQNAHHGKVRDSFVFEDKRAVVVSDRISAFDFVLGTIPYKGAVLNQIAAWWFNQLDAIDVPHHLMDVPHPNISIVKNVQVLPIEIVVRGYLTGSTKTSSWYAYQNHDRTICGLTMPPGMKKNEKFSEPMITPTTKPDLGHDENVSREQIFERRLGN